MTARRNGRGACPVVPTVLANVLLPTRKDNVTDESLTEQVSAVAAAEVAKHPRWERRVEEIFT